MESRRYVFSHVKSVLLILANKLPKRCILSVFSLTVQLSNLIAHPVGIALPRSVSMSWVPTSLASVKFARLTIALLRSALVRFVLVRSDLLRCAPLRLAPVRLAPLSRAWVRFAYRRSVLLRSAFARFVPCKLASRWIMWRRSALLRSGWISKCSCLHRFHVSTPCLSRSRCS